MTNFTLRSWIYSFIYDIFNISGALLQHAVPHLQAASAMQIILSIKGDTLVDLFVWLIVSSPVLAPLGVVAFAVHKTIRFIRIRKSKKQTDQPPIIQ